MKDKLPIVAGSMAGVLCVPILYAVVEYTVGASHWGLVALVVATMVASAAAAITGRRRLCGLAGILVVASFVLVLAVGDTGPEPEGGKGEPSGNSIGLLLCMIPPFVLALPTVPLCLVAALRRRPR